MINGQTSRMESSFQKLKLPLVVLVAVVLPPLISLAAHWGLGNASHVNEPLHEGMELVGACIAWSVALLLLLRLRHEASSPHMLWAAVALVVMGLMDGVHATVSFGSAWSWLRHMATLMGGILFAMVWLPPPVAVIGRNRFVILIAAVLSLGVSAAIWRWAQWLPAPFLPGGYSIYVKAANGLGGLAFLAAAAFFCRRYLRQPCAEDLVFAGHTALFGTASLLFGFSNVWAADWWVWHWARLAAYAVILSAAYEILAELYQQLGRHTRELEDRVQARTAELSQSEARFRALYEQAPMGIARLDSRTGRFLQVNARYCEIAGRSEAEMLAADFQSITLSDDLAANLDSMRRLLSGETRVFEVDKRYLRPDGAVVWVNLTVVPEWADGTTPSTHIAMVADITERKRAEEALAREKDSMEIRVRERTAELRRNQELLNETQGISRVGGWEYDVATRRVIWTDEVYRIHGLTRDYDPSDPGQDMEFYSPEDQSRIAEAFQRAIEHGEPYDLELQLVTAQGGRIWVRTLGRVERSEGEVVRVFGNIMDITERKQAQAAIEELNATLERRVAERTAELAVSEQRFRLALKNAPVSVAIQDCNFVYQWAYNQRTRRPDEIVGKTDADLFAPEDIPEILEVKRKVLESGTEVHVQHWLTSNGRRLFLDLYYEPLRDADGAITGIGIAVVDLTEQKLAEEALRESERRYSALFANKINGMAHCRIITDEQGRPVDYVILQINEAYERIIGIKKADIEGRRVTAVFPEIKQYSLDYIGMYGKIALEGSEIQFEEFFEATGQCLSIYAYSPVRGEFIAIFTDVTERKRAEEALRQKETELLEAQRIAHVGSWHWDATTDITTGSDELLRIYGFDPATQRMPDFNDQRGRCYPVEDWERVNEAVQKTMRTGIGYQLEVGAIRNGTPIWIMTRSEVVHDGAGRIVGLRGTVQDITERKRAEEALRESESFYRQTLESIPGMVFTTRPDGYCDYQSQQWVEFTGVPMAEHLGDGWNKLLHPDDRPRSYAAWKAAVEGRAPYDLEYRVRRHDGVYEWFKVIGRPIQDAEGRIVRWFGVAANIQELKQTEEALREADRRKEVLLKEVHHRVKNNMQVISSLVSLQADGMQDPAVRDVLRDMTDRVRSMALVHEKLYQSADLAQVDFAEYTRSLLNYLWRAHGTAVPAVRLTLDLEPVPLSVDAAVPCGLILNELAGNALKHAFSGRSAGDVIVALREDADGRVRLLVRDNGVGMPEDFELGQTRSLGLRLVQILTDQLDGTVEIRVNDGTEFEVAFGASRNQP